LVISADEEEAEAEEESWLADDGADFAAAAGAVLAESFGPEAQPTLGRASAAISHHSLPALEPLDNILPDGQFSGMRKKFAARNLRVPPSTSGQTYCWSGKFCVENQ